MIRKILSPERSEVFSGLIRLSIPINIHTIRVCSKYGCVRALRAPRLVNTNLVRLLSEIQAYSGFCRSSGWQVFFHMSDVQPITLEAGSRPMFEAGIPTFLSSADVFVKSGERSESPNPQIGNTCGLASAASGAHFTCRKGFRGSL